MDASSTTPAGIFGNYASNDRSPIAPQSAGNSIADQGKKKRAMSTLNAIMATRSRAADPFSPGSMLMPGSGGIEAANYFDQMRMNPLNTYF